MRSMSEMPYHIGIKVKLYPSNHQKHLVAVNDGAKRAVYNHLVACGNEKYLLSRTKVYVSADQARLEYLNSVTGAVKNIKNALPFLYGKEVDEQAVANAICNYKAAWKNMKNLHTGVPTFKKKSYELSYQTNAHYYADRNGEVTSNVRFEDKNHVVLPKLGRIRIGGSPKLVQMMLDRKYCIRIGTVTVSRDAVGEYWAAFSLASEEQFHKPLPGTGRQTGIDLNLLELVNDSDGNSYRNERFYQSAEKKLAKQQHRMSRMAEHAKQEHRPLRESKNYQKQRRKVAFTHRKIARQREDYLHRLSRQEIENQDFIAAEDLKVKNMIRNHRLAKAIADAGWGRFLTMLQYKAELYGRTVVLVPPQYTTQTCSQCGYVLQKNEQISLSVREWICPNCQAHHHRDTNASRNILKKGLAMQS